MVPPFQRFLMRMPVGDPGILLTQASRPRIHSGSYTLRLRCGGIRAAGLRNATPAAPAPAESFGMCLRAVGC